MANYGEVKPRADSGALLDKALGDGGHVALLAAGDPMTARWQEWMERGAPYEAASGAADAGPPTDGGPTGALTWTDHVDPIIVSYDCRRCHGAVSPQGNYSLSTYADALGVGTDETPNVIPGDADSLLIQYCRDGHEGIRYADALVILNWIVDYGAQEN